MRISSMQMVTQATNAMLDRQHDLSKTQEQLATGRRIVKPSDDPLGSTRVLGLNDDVSLIDQFKKNTNSAQTRLELEESILANVTDVLQSIRERVLQAANSTLTSANRIAIGQDVLQSIQQLLSLANTRESNGDYLFAGNNVDTEPFVEDPPGTFTYTGDQGQRFVQIGHSRQIATGDSGEDVFVNMPYSGGGTQDIFTTLSTVASNLQAGTVDTAALDDIDAAMEEILSTRARVGSRLKAIDEQNNINEDALLSNKSALSGIQDLDYAEAVARMQLELAGLQASQQSFALVQNLSLFNYL